MLCRGARSDARGGAHRPRGGPHARRDRRADHRAHVRPCGVRAAGRRPVHQGDLTKVVIGHAGDSNNVDYLMELADSGATLGMDRFGLDIFNPTADRVRTIAALAARGYSDRMVLSHDSSCFIDYFGSAHDPARAAAAPNWHHEYISDDVLPALREAGVTEAQIDQMLVENPRRYFGA